MREYLKFIGNVAKYSINDMVYANLLNQLLSKSEQASKEFVEDTILLQNYMGYIFQSRQGASTRDCAELALYNLPRETKEKLTPIFENIFTHAIQNEFGIGHGKSENEIRSQDVIKTITCAVAWEEKGGLSKKFMEKHLLDKETNLSDENMCHLMLAHLALVDTINSSFWVEVDFDQHPHLYWERFVAYAEKDPAEAFKTFDLMKDKSDFFLDEKNQSAIDDYMKLISTTLEFNEEDEACIEAAKNMPLWIKKYYLEWSFNYSKKELSEIDQQNIQTNLIEGNEQTITENFMFFENANYMNQQERNNYFANYKFN